MHMYVLVSLLFKLRGLLNREGETVASSVIRVESQRQSKLTVDKHQVELNACNISIPTRQEVVVNRDGRNGGTTASPLSMW